MHALLCLLLLAVATPATAARIDLTAPAAPVALADGDDYATTVLGDPWDFEKRREFLSEDHFSSVGVANGIWTGVLRGTGAATVSPVFQGFTGSLTAIHVDLPEFGTNRPVNADRYTELSYRLNGTSRSFFSVYWTRNTSLPHPCGQFPAESCNAEAGSVLGRDAEIVPAAVIPRTGWAVYDFNLNDPASIGQPHGAAWGGLVTGLLLHPSADGGAGDTLQFDWIRLVDPSTSPVLPIEWQSTAAPPGATVNVWADGSGGCTGEIIRHEIANNGRHDLKTAMLPPGTYRFHVELVQWNSSLTGFDVLATSGCSAPVTIASAPILRFTSPSVTTGADYATEAAGNAWDMSGPEDLANVGDDEATRGWTNGRFENGTFRATAIAPGRHAAWSDASLRLAGPAQMPIDTSRYRYLTFRLWNDTSHFQDTTDYQVRGGGLRAIFWDAGLGADGTDGTPALLYEDWHEYAIDLWTLPGDPTDVNTPNPGWRGIPWVTTLNVDPTEVQISSDFAFDTIALRAENCTATTFDVGWTLDAPGGGALTVDLFADGDTAGADGAHLTGPLPVSAGAGSATVDLQGLGAGRWYVYARVADGVHERTVYSRVPIVTPCAAGATAATFVPQTGVWEALGIDAFRAVQSGAPALGVFADVDGSAARVSTRLAPDGPRGRGAFVFAYKGPQDYAFVEFDLRRLKVGAFRVTGGKKRKIKLGKYWRPKRERFTPVPVVMRVLGGGVEVSAEGKVILSIASTDTQGAVGLGVIRSGTVQMTQMRASAASGSETPAR